jgi:hypothetical protein
MRRYFSPPLQASDLPVPNDLQVIRIPAASASTINIDQNCGFAIAVDPVLLAVAVVGQPELHVFAALGDVIDQAVRLDVCRGHGKEAKPAFIRQSARDRRLSDT